MEKANHLHVRHRSLSSTRTTVPVRLLTAILVVALVLFGVPVTGFAATEEASGKEEPQELIRPVRAIKVSDPYTIKLRDFPGRAKAT